jgi:hypothetical protein
MQRAGLEDKVKDYFNSVSAPTNYRFEQHTAEFETLQKKLETHDQTLKAKFETILKTNSMPLDFATYQTNSKLETAHLDPLLSAYEQHISKLQQERSMLGGDNLRLLEISELMLEDNSNLRTHLRKTQLALNDIISYYSNLIRRTSRQNANFVQRADRSSETRE